MGSYFVRRLITAVPTLWAVVTVCFFLMRLASGGPFDNQAPVPPEILENLRARYHLDQPLFSQYLDYFLNLLRGDFGPSFKYKDFTVTQLIAQGPARQYSKRIGGPDAGTCNRHSHGNPRRHPPEYCT